VRASRCAVRYVPPPHGAQGLTALRGIADVVEFRSDHMLGPIEQQALEPIDLDQVEHAGELAGPFRHAASDRLDGVDYGVPYRWGVDSLIVRVGAFPGGVPTSARVLYAPGLAGRIAVRDDPLGIAQAAQYLGVSRPFDLAADDLAAALRLLRHQQPLVARYWRTPSQLERLLRSGRIDVASGPSWLVRALRRSTALAALVPAEGAIGTTRSLAIVADAPHPVCALRFLGAMLDARAQAVIGAATRSGPTNPGACRLLGRRACARLHAADGTYLDRVVFAEAPGQDAGSDQVAGPAEWLGEWAGIAPSRTP
jgi:putative spermidine/putrescine transport system substrate-binding protein